MDICSGFLNIKKNIQVGCGQFYNAAVAKLPSKRACLGAVALPAIGAAAYYYLTNASGLSLATETPTFSNITDVVNGTAVYSSLDNQQPLFAPIRQMFAKAINETTCGLEDSQAFLPSITSNLTDTMNITVNESPINILAVDSAICDIPKTDISDDEVKGLDVLQNVLIRIAGPILNICSCFLANKFYSANQYVWNKDSIEKLDLSLRGYINSRI